MSSLPFKLARDSGLDIAADMYPYPAGATALASALPPWVADGGVQKLLERLEGSRQFARASRKISPAIIPIGKISSTIAAELQAF